MSSLPLAPADGSANGKPAFPRNLPALPAPSLPPATVQKRNGSRPSGKRDAALTRDALFIIRRDGGHHVIAESYFYKTEPYYTILALEHEGKKVKPSSTDVLDAYVIPVCLERAKAAGVPVCEWGISQVYVPLPALLYGLHYFATNSEYAIVRDNDTAKERIRHITNNGKYPFIFQKFPEGSEVVSCTAIFGRTAGACSRVAGYATTIYGLFSIPLARMVWVKQDDAYALSSLSPLRYSQLGEQERAILAAYLSDQELL